MGVETIPQSDTALLCYCPIPPRFNALGQTLNRWTLDPAALGHAGGIQSPKSVPPICVQHGKRLPPTPTVCEQYLG